jgi:hypothetical protein
MAYASWTADFNPQTSFEDKQWEEPVIFRFNGQECKVYIKVEPGRNVTPLFSPPTEYDTSADGGFTEVEIAMPVATYWNEKHDELIQTLRDYYRKAKLAKMRTDISFTVENEEGKE